MYKYGAKLRIKSHYLVLLGALFVTVMADQENQNTNLPQQQTGDSTFVFPPRSLDCIFGSNTDPRKTWPEVVGLTGEEAERKIKEEMPTIQIQVIPPDTFVTMDFNTQRVRLHVDTSGKVIKPPQIG